MRRSPKIHPSAVSCVITAYIRARILVQQFITVEDVSGVQLKHLASSRLWKVMKALTGTMKEHYVERQVVLKRLRSPPQLATAYAVHF